MTGLAARALTLGARLPASTAGALIGVGLAVSWVSSTAFGGAGAIPPHGYYVPILLAGIRFGLRGAFATALASTMLAGPMTYADVATRTAQPLSDWTARGVFFVVIGVALTAMTQLRTAALAAEVADLREAKRLWSALQDGRFSLRYQPIVSMRDGGRIVGVEALLRLDGPEGAETGPDQFIPLAERTGTIRPLGAWVLLDACRQCVAWRRDGLVRPGFRLHVNVSAKELDADSYVAQVRDTLRGTGLEAEHLCLEITETSLSEDPERFVDTLHDLRRLGVGLALDDYGTGHASLWQAQRFPVDVLKIDQSFVTGVEDGQRDTVFAEHVASLARSLGIATIAEGVERPEEAEALERMGCDLAQGFHFGRPMGADEFALSLASEGDAPASDTTTAAEAGRRTLR